MSYVHPFSKRCDKSEIDLFSVPPTQQSLERGRWIDYAPLSSVENPDSAITYLIAGTDEYIDLSKTILTVVVMYLQTLRLKYLLVSGQRSHNSGYFMLYKI